MVTTKSGSSSSGWLPTCLWVAAVLLVGAATLLLWIQSGPFRHATAASGDARSVLNRKGAKHGSDCVYRDGRSDHQVLGATESAKKTAAATNLSEFRASLAARMRPLNHDTSYWPHFPPVISCPPERPLTRYGGFGDGSKLLCRLPTSLRDGKRCVIYSLGSHGDFQFEMAMLEASQCEVHTFDCTYKQGASQHQGRHFYHSWCVGDPQQGPDFRTFAQITQVLNHTAVDLLKMDIDDSRLCALRDMDTQGPLAGADFPTVIVVATEGHEYSIMEAFRSDEALPTDLSVELHVNRTDLHTFRSTTELGLQFLHLAEVGYAAYSREPNPLCGACCEFSFKRLDGP